MIKHYKQIVHSIEKSKDNLDFLAFLDHLNENNLFSQGSVKNATESKPEYSVTKENEVLTTNTMRVNALSVKSRGNPSILFLTIVYIS